MIDQKYGNKKRPVLPDLENIGPAYTSIYFCKEDGEHEKQQEDEAHQQDVDIVYAEKLLVFCHEHEIVPDARDKPSRRFKRRV